jgi:Zn finger protein HypA/HybF involved in hydrogenase expression
MSGKWHGGKGSRPRPYSVDQKTFGDNFDNIFRKKKTEIECGECNWKGSIDETMPSENLEGMTCPSCGSEL